MVTRSMLTTWQRNALVAQMSFPTDLTSADIGSNTFAMDTGLAFMGKYLVDLFQCVLTFFRVMGRVWGWFQRLSSYNFNSNMFRDFIAVRVDIFTYHPLNTYSMSFVHFKVLNSYTFVIANGNRTWVSWISLAWIFGFFPAAQTNHFSVIVA